MKYKEVLVPSLGISLFNECGEHRQERLQRFSSPLWGFLYLIKSQSYRQKKKNYVLVPSLGISLFNSNLRQAYQTD